MILRVYAALLSDTVSKRPAVRRISQVMLRESKLGEAYTQKRSLAVLSQLLIDQWRCLGTYPENGCDPQMKVHIGKVQVRWRTALSSRFRSGEPCRAASVDLLLTQQSGVRC